MTVNILEAVKILFLISRRIEVCALCQNVTVLTNILFSLFVFVLLFIYLEPAVCICAASVMSLFKPQ